MTLTRAAVLRGQGEPLSVEEVTFADPLEHEVVVRVVAASVCHSDLHVINSAVPHLPMIVGHEAAGIVEQTGPGVKNLFVGDKVVFSFVPSCGNCYACARGREVECERGSQIGGDGCPLEGSYRARSADGLEVGQMVRLGAFSEFTVVHQDSCQRIPDDTDLRIAALLSCGFVTGAGAAVNTAGTRVGDTVVVVGVGGVGTAALQGAVIAGAAEVIAVDVHDHKLASAKHFGATKTVNAQGDDWTSVVLEFTRGRGADRAITCVGRIDDEHLRQVMGVLREGGHGVIVGAGRAQIDVAEMGRKTLTRTLYGSVNPKRDQLRFLDLHRAGRLKLEDMITATYTLDGINDCLADLVKGKLIRGVIEFGQSSAMGVST